MDPLGKEERSLLNSNKTQQIVLLSKSITERGVSWHMPAAIALVKLGQEDTDWR